MLEFTKMHGAGNDYIYVDAINQKISNPKNLAIKMSNRNFGIGSDGIILILRSRKADFRMKMFNADGSEAEMCGNGIRCFAKYVYDHKYTNKKNLTIETLSGIKRVNLFFKNKKVSKVKVDMGEPIFERKYIPMIGEPGAVIEEPLPLDGVKLKASVISMGNPHAVIYVEDVENFPVMKYGSLIENHSLFPNRTNVEFVEIINRAEVKIRTWERGSGETLACGTGASASIVAGVLTKRTERNVITHLAGGDLEINWSSKDNHVYMTGPAVEVFRGQWMDKVSP